MSHSYKIVSCNLVCNSLVAPGYYILYCILYYIFGSIFSIILKYIILMVHRISVQAVRGSAGSIHFRFDPVRFSRFRFHSWASCLFKFEN